MRDEHKYTRLSQDKPIAWLELWAMFWAWVRRAPTF